jgi:hypothetical protein
MMKVAGPDSWRTWVTCWAIVLGAAAAWPLAVARPDLTGSWTRVSDDVAIPDAAAAERYRKAADSFCGLRCKIAQDRDTITIIRDEYQDKPTVVFKTDGSLNINKFVGPSGDVVLESTAEYVGEKLELSTRISNAGVRSRQVLSISRVGATLVVARHIQSATGGVRTQVYEHR